MSRSLTVHPDYLETVRSAYQVRYARQKDLAQDTKVSADTVNKFLNGKPIAREIFWNLCDVLEVPWEKVITPLSIPQAKKSLDAATKQTLCTSLEAHIKLEPASISLKNLAFIGREQEHNYLQHLSQQGYRCILLLAPGGIGKTTLAQHFLNTQFDTYIEFSIAKEERNIASAASLVEEKLRQLGEEPGREFLISLERLRSKLRTQKIGVLIDNLEPALDGNGQFLEEHKDYIDLLRVLADPLLQSLTIITSREPIYEGLDIHYMLLPSLKLEDWKTFFSHSDIQFSDSVLAEMHQAYNGNALAMKVLCNAIKQYFRGNVSDYWIDCKADLNPVIETAIVNLIKAQFNRLQKINPSAYNLLCRMGCYRYQDVPTVPLEGLLCLLWDISEGKKQLVDTLVRCSLIECKGNEYYLHPIIHIEAIRRLKEKNQAYREANKKAAKFWETSVKDIKFVNDGLKKLEAYYHFIELQEYSNAAKLITYDSKEEYAYLTGTSLVGKMRGFGAYQKLLEILENLSDSPGLSHFNKQHILGFKGDINAILGYSQNAILAYNGAIEIARRHSDLIHLCDCTAALALLYINLGEYSKSVDLFKEVVALHEKSEENSLKTLSDILYQVIEASLSCLSFVYFLQNDPTLSLTYLDLSSHISSPSRGLNDGSWWSIYGRYYYALSSMSHGRLDEVDKVCENLRTFYQKNPYPLAQGIVFELTGRALLKKAAIQEAITCFSEAELIFERLGLNSNLAEVSIQLGLIYNAMGEIEKSLKNRDKAIRLFTKIEAFQQVERVKQIFSDSQICKN